MLFHTFGLWNISPLFLWVNSVIQSTLAPKGDDVLQVLLLVKLPAQQLAPVLPLLRDHLHVALVQVDGWLVPGRGLSSQVSKGHCWSVVDWGLNASKVVDCRL